MILSMIPSMILSMIRSDPIRLDSIRFDSPPQFRLCESDRIGSNRSEFDASYGATGSTGRRD
jgi:hypothetical protein